jgi:hypothetical protein
VLLALTIPTMGASGGHVECLHGPFCLGRSSTKLFIGTGMGADFLPISVPTTHSALSEQQRRTRMTGADGLTGAAR